MASKWHLKHSNKTTIILIICSKRPQNGIIQIVAFLTYSAKVVKYAPEGSRGAPGGPAGGSRHSIGLYGYHCIPYDSMEFIAFYRILRIPLHSQDSLDSIGFHRILWISQDSLRFYGFFQILQDSVDFIGFHTVLWISLDSIGCNGFHWIPQDSMDFIEFQTYYRNYVKLLKNQKQNSN